MVSQPKAAASPKMSQRQSAPVPPSGVSTKSGTTRPGQAPPVYRPQPTVSQPKGSAPSWPQRPPTKAVTGLPKPTAPPVYRPQAAVSQPKMQAPPVFQPQSAAFIPPHLRAEFSVAQPKSVAPPAALRPSQVRGAQTKRVIAPVLRGVVMAKISPYGFHSRTIQRKTGDKDALAEAETVTLAQGEAVKFTKLIGGCLAITACFSGGGGAALHMVMDQDNASQWNEFVGLVEGKTVSKIYLDSDMLELKEGWRVKIKPASDETLWLEAPDTTVGPKSALSLNNNLDNWSYGSGTFAEWFAEKFGIAQKNVLVSNTTVGVTHQC